MTRVLSRLQRSADAVIDQLGSVLTAIQRATLYVSHQGRATCFEAEPLCHIHPLRSPCAFPRLRGEPPTPLRKARPQEDPNS